VRRVRGALPPRAVRTCSRQRRRLHSCTAPASDCSWPRRFVTPSFLPSRVVPWCGKLVLRLFFPRGTGWPSFLTSSETEGDAGLGALPDPPCGFLFFSPSFSGTKPPTLAEVTSPGFPLYGSGLLTPLLPLSVSRPAAFSPRVGARRGPVMTSFVDLRVPSFFL